MIALIFAVLVNIVMLYDVDNNDIPEGVGPGRPIVLIKGLDFRFGNTNENSAQSFDLNNGTWVINSEFKSDVPTYIWVCKDRVEVLNEPKTVVVECVRQFIFRIPFLER